jgi:hypothetical protein
MRPTTHTYTHPAAPDTCPAKPLAEIVLHDAQNLNANLRLLRSKMANCTQCAPPAQCPIRTDLTAQIDIAIREITEEWAL